MNPLVLLAKQAVETYIEDKNVIPVPEKFPKEFLQKRAGVFVTIEKKKELRGLPRSEPKVLLRGCIGTYLPVRDNIAEEIIHNAISAATEDFRFGPIKKTELPHLSYTVYILNKPEKVSDISELDPKKFGIIVKSGPSSASADAKAVADKKATAGKEKSGLLLPDLEGVNTVAEQISICCQKGGIYLKEENIEIYKFTVEKYAQQ